MTIFSGGFIAAGSFSYYLLVILRKQGWILFNYVVNIGIGIAVSVVLVQNFSILGGALSIVISQALLFLGSAAILVFFLRRSANG